MNLVVLKLQKELSEALKLIYNGREANLIAQYVMEDLFEKHLPFHENSFLDDGEYRKFLEAKKKLMDFVPWQYVVGKADFHGLKFCVNPSVLIPRPETEELVSIILKEQKGVKKVLDIGTGTGCIAISLAKNSTFELEAIDISVKALEIARKNNLMHGTTIQFRQVNILNYQQYEWQVEYDIIVSNPPYIAQKEKSLMPRHVLDHEPTLALFVENEDVLQFYRTIGNFALKHLKKDGFLYFELNQFYAIKISVLLKDMGFQKVEIIADFLEQDRFIRAQK